MIIFKRIRWVNPLLGQIFLSLGQARVKGKQALFRELSVSGLGQAHVSVI
tara:strand:- start:399 stop:548 length:150 start_codon:yes stop_codon:yes gene_type:complete